MTGHERCVRPRMTFPGRVVLAVAVALCAVYAGPMPGRGQDSPADFTGAVLSFIDAAAGRVEVVRHWPQPAVDVDVYPFVPYFWTGCPGPGAVMVLVTGTPGAPGNAAAVPDIGRTREIGTRFAETIWPAPRDDSNDLAEIRRLAAGSRTPGDSILEAAKALVPIITDLGTYERRGYAVFGFITWQGWRCGVTFRAVPEGYGIPFVR
ncbi:MAG TPA: hypothetical protein VKT83_00525 [bacterium]|nr:hypothetical protein [bacterium]